MSWATGARDGARATPLGPGVVHMLLVIPGMNQVLMGRALARLTLTAGVVAALIAIDTRSARACSCAVQTPEQAFAGSTAVFLGIAREIAQTPIPSSFGPLLEVEFEVSRVWKGDVTLTQVVVTPTGSTVCGFGFQTGRAYLVYGNRNDSGLWTSICSHTRATDLAAGELGLGPGSEPTEIPDASASDAPAPVAPSRDAAAGSGGEAAGSADADTISPAPNAGGSGGCHAGGHLPRGGGAPAAALLLLLLASMARRSLRGPSRRAR
jgi:hypothetical protein